MYLGDSLVLEGRVFPMAGIFPVAFGLERKPQGHGYAVAVPDRENPFYPTGVELVGHEFHYSRPLTYDPARINLVFKVNRGHGFDNGRDGLVAHNVLGTYIHLHALGNTYWAEGLVARAAEYQSMKNRGKEIHEP